MASLLVGSLVISKVLLLRQDLEDEEEEKENNVE